MAAHHVYRATRSLNRFGVNFERGDYYGFSGEGRKRISSALVFSGNASNRNVWFNRGFECIPVKIVAVDDTTVEAKKKVRQVFGTTK